MPSRASELAAAAAEDAAVERARSALAEPAPAETAVVRPPWHMRMLLRAWVGLARLKRYVWGRIWHDCAAHDRPGGR